MLCADPTHCSGFSYLNSMSMTCSSAAMRLMISETPCSAIRQKPTGSSSFTGQRTRPPAFDDASLMLPGIDEPRPGEIGEDDADRQQEQNAADDVDPDAGALGHHAVDEVDAHVLVHLERVGRAEQHHAGEHVPLDFQPAVRAFAEQIAAAGVAGADQRGEQHEIIGDDAEFVIHGVDRGADLQQSLQASTPQPDERRGHRAAAEECNGADAISAAAKPFHCPLGPAATGRTSSSRTDAPRGAQDRRS